MNEPSPIRARKGRPSPPIPFAVRVSPEVAAAIKTTAARYGLASGALVEKLVERVFIDDLVKAVLDE